MLVVVIWTRADLKSSKKTSSQSLRFTRFNPGVAVAVVAAVVVLGYVVVRSFAAAGQLYVTPASATYTNGQAISIQVYANTGGDPTNAVEADFSYPQAKLQFVSIDGTGSAYDIDASSSGGNGVVTIGRGHAGTVTGVALVATVHFNVISTGSASITFLNSSHLVRSTDNADILASTVGGNYTLNAAATPTPTPTHTPTPTPTPAKTPTPAPGATAKTPTPSPSKSPVAGGTAATPTPAVAANATPTPPVATVNPAATAAPFVNKAKPLFGDSKVLGYAAVGVPVLVILGLVAMWLMRFRGAAGLAGAHGADQTFVASTPQPTVPPAMPVDLATQNKTFMPGGGDGSTPPASNPQTPPADNSASGGDNPPNPPTA